MCWSLPVSVAFSIVDITALTALFLRNESVDRLCCLAFAPIAIQEVGQAGLWSTIGINSYSCTDKNIYLSLFVCSVIAWIPPGVTYASIRSLSIVEKKAGRWGKFFLVGSILYSIVYLGLIWYSFFKTPIGTSIGPNHHQVWPPYFGYYNNYIAYTIFGLNGYAFFTLIPPIIFFNPRWFGWLVSITIGCSIFYLNTFFPIEWPSMWCWSAFIIFFFCLARPYVQNFISTQRENFLRRNRHRRYT